MGINFIEEQVKINGDVILKGTLAIPRIENKKFSAVLIVNGSGNIDRDGNIKKSAIKGNTYKELAHFITGLGFITLRYDKRGVGESQGNLYSIGMMDLVNDINRNVKFLKSHLRVDKDKVILLGHSEGCILSTIANTINPVGGLVLIGGAGTNLMGPIEYQNAQAIDEVKRLKGLKGFVLRLMINEKKIQRKQKELYKKMINSTEDIIRYKFKKIPAKWFREHFRYSSEDVLKALTTAKCPILAITGEKDVQANPEDLKSIEKLGKDNIKWLVVENMDHMLKEFTGEKTLLNLMKQYKKEALQPIHFQLKMALEQWFNKFKF